MIVTKKLLSYIDPIFEKIDDKKFIETCNKTGIEVETIKDIEIAKNLEVVKILEINKHPNADRLSIVKIQTKDDTKEIVCGANNLKVNKYAIYAPVGTKIKDFIIQARTIRDVASEGMLCGYEEITDFDPHLISEKDKSGIILLDEAEIGSSKINKLLGLDDTIYDLSIASNRNDLNSVLLFAKEFKYAYNQTFDLKFEIEFDNKIGWTGVSEIDNSFVNEASFIKIKNIKKYHPNWKEKAILLASGYKVQNNWWDLINLLSIYYGNAINIYDGLNINLNKIKIKKIEEAYSFKSQNEDIEAKPGMYGIFCNDKLINLQGYVINDDYKFNEDSISIVIEVNNYNSSIINKFSDEIKIKNKQFVLNSKPLSSWISQNTYNELSKYLLKQYKNDLEVIRTFKPIATEVISINPHEIYTFIGLDDAISFNDLLKHDRYIVHPSRLDINNKYDVFEEVLKLIDINSLKPKTINFNYMKTDYLIYNQLETIKRYLIDWGFYETKTYNLSNQQDYQKFDILNNNSKIKVLNPISKAREYLRNNPIDEQLKVIKYNLSRKRELHNVFEIQNINSSNTKYFNTLSMVLVEDISFNKLVNNNINLSFINIKAILTNAFNKINVTFTYNDASELVNEIYEEVKVINVNNSPVGYVMKLTNKVKNDYDLNEIKDVYAIIINLEDLLGSKKDCLIHPVTNYPLVHRDINIISANEEVINKVLAKLKDVDHIYDCKIKEMFVKDQQHIYTLSLVIYDNEKTLNSEEIDEIIKSVNNLIDNIVN